MPGRLEWDRDGADWPNRSASRFVEAAGMRWHVQVAGEGPVILLLHGTGAATHSWRDLLPLLARRYTVVAPDLPGHGFTDPAPRGNLSLPAMARRVTELSNEIGRMPRFVLGHSAGAAIAVRMVLDRQVRPTGILAVNGALMPFGGAVAPFFAPVARLLAAHPMVPRVFAWQARNGPAVDRLLEKTGSRIDPAGAALYRRLVQSSHHVAAALGMMADWDLKSLAEDLPRLDVPLTLLVGGDDRMVPPEDAFRVRQRVPAASVVFLRGLGHLLHEEDPALVDEIVDRMAALCLFGDAGRQATIDATPPRAPAAPESGTGDRS